MGVLNVGRNVLNWVAQVGVRASLQQHRPPWKPADERLPKFPDKFSRFPVDSADHMKQCAATS